MWQSIADKVLGRKPAEIDSTGILLTETSLVGLAALDETYDRPGLKSVEQCRGQHLKKFGDTLDEEQRREYSRLTQGLKVSRYAICRKAPRRHAQGAL